MNENDLLVVEAMENYGGSFVKNLAALARSADYKNLAKIKRTWPEYWLKYAGFAKDKK